MAERKDDQVEQAAPPPQAVSFEEWKAQRSAQLAEEVANLKLDETKPGGRYKFGDIYVDAWGNEVK